MLQCTHAILHVTDKEHCCPNLCMDVCFLGVKRLDLKNVEASLHAWNKPHMDMMYNPFIYY